MNKMYFYRTEVQFWGTWTLLEYFQLMLLYASTPLQKLTLYFLLHYIRLLTISNQVQH